MDLNPGTIKHLQEYVADKIKARGFEDETLHERLVLLMEEVGELAKACRKVSGMNSDQNRGNMLKVGEEVVDVINLALAVSIKLDLDMEKEFFEKEAKIDKRFYKRPDIKETL